jgi:2-polyprenylphenol hydroxylase and related flavodoxin oxidoreductases
VAKKVAAATKETAVTTNVILQGPYGVDVTEGLIQDVNVLCVAGGTGITYVLPVLLRLVRGPVGTTGRKIELVWAMKRKRDLEWVAPELEELQRLGAAHGLQICTFVTADPEDSSSKESGDENGATESGDDVKTFRSQRPDVGLVVQEFVKSVSQGSVRVFGSGPPGMICDLRAAVAKCNSGSKVWKGEDRFDVHLVCDDRLE